MLREGTNFWVVRPRVSTTDVSGLGTLITGAYVELDPGPTDGAEVNHFNGLETPPATNRNIPGLRLTLLAEEAGSLNAGSPIFYRGFEVGRIENRKLDLVGQRVTYDAFIQEKYSSLVKENTRFWNTSGIDITAGADGFKLRTPSFQAMLSGGATFGVQEGIRAGKRRGGRSDFHAVCQRRCGQRLHLQPNDEIRPALRPIGARTRQVRSRGIPGHSDRPGRGYFLRLHEGGE